MSSLHSHFIIGLCRFLSFSVCCRRLFSARFLIALLSIGISARRDPEHTRLVVQLHLYAHFFFVFSKKTHKTVRGACLDPRRSVNNPPRVIYLFRTWNCFGWSRHEKSQSAWCPINRRDRLGTFHLPFQFSVCWRPCDWLLPHRTWRASLFRQFMLPPGIEKLAKGNAKNNNAHRREKPGQKSNRK